jgi:hypothetical protein
MNPVAEDTEFQEVNAAVDGDREQFAEGGEIHARQSEDGLLVVESGARVMVVIPEDVLRKGSGRKSAEGYEQRRDG